MNQSPRTRNIGLPNIFEFLGLRVVSVDVSVTLGMWPHGIG